MTKVGIVGVGNWGRKIIKTLSEMEGVEIVSCVSSSGNSQWLRENFPEIPCSKDYNSILERDDIDAVLIATPNETHYSLAKKALEKKKHVFLEKPMTEKYEESEELEKLAKNNKLTLMIGHVFLYHPVFSKIKDIIQKEKLKSIYFNWDKWGTFDKDIISNLVVHDFAITRALCGKLEKVKVNSIKKISEDIVNIDLEYNEIPVIINVNRLAQINSKKVYMITESAKYLWEDNRLYTMDKEFKQIFASEKKPLSIELEEFLSCIKSGEKPFSDPVLGKDVTKIIEIVRT